MPDITTVLTGLFSLAVTVATVVIACATVKYVKLNATLVEETRLLRKAQTDPRISVFIKPRDPLNQFVDLIIRNDSQAQARNLRCQVYPDLYYFDKRKFSDIDFLQYLPSLQLGEQRSRSMFTAHWRLVDKPEEQVPEIVIVTAKYEDILGNQKEEKFPLPIKSFTHGENWNTEATETPFDLMAKSLKALEQTAKICLEYVKQKQTLSDL